MFEEYSYIWDGIDPTWRIEKFYNYCYEVIVTFDLQEPTKEEKLAILKVSQDFKSIGEVHKHLKGKTEFKLGEYDSVSITSANILCEQENLNYKVINKSKFSSILRNKDHALLIEDDNECKQLTDYAESKGVPVVEQTD